MRTLINERRKFFIVPLILVAIAAFSAITMVLWNALMPVIFNLQMINFWQAMGLLVLARLFFGGFRPGRRWPGPYMNRELRKKILKMSPEEREEFFRKMHHNREVWHRQYFERKEPGAENSKTE